MFCGDWGVRIKNKRNDHTEFFFYVVALCLFESTRFHNISLTGVNSVHVHVCACAYFPFAAA